MLGAYTEDAGEYQEVVDRLRRKWETAKRYVPAPGRGGLQRAMYRAGIISIGSCDAAVREAREQLEQDGCRYELPARQGVSLQ